MSDTSTQTDATTDPVSVVDETMDQLIQQASVPNLASLFRKAKEAGAIGPVSVYGEWVRASAQGSTTP